jgi:hypothetical protein
MEIVRNAFNSIPFPMLVLWEIVQYGLPTVEIVRFVKI